MRNISRAAALGLVATAVGAVPAHAGVTAPSGGRAYERVTAQGTSSPPTGAAVSDDGGQVAFRWGATLPQATNGFVSQTAYIAQRSAAGWLMGEAVPGPLGVRRPEPFMVEPSTMRAILVSEGGAIGVDAGVWRRAADGSLTELLRVPAPSATTPAPYFRAFGASRDLSRVFVYTREKLLPEALSAPAHNIYQVAPGGLKLISVRPDGTAVSASPGSSFLGDPGQPDALSSDGRVVFFQDEFGVEKSVYARVDGTQTIDVSASQRATPDPAGPQPRQFEGASRDGQHVYFTSAEALTDDAETAGGTEAELYDYDMESGQLRTITPGFPIGESPRVVGVTAIAPNADRVYFAARAALPGTDAVDGGLNLYRYDAAADDLAFVATLIEDYMDGNLVRTDRPLTNPGYRYGMAVVSDDGSRLLFESQGSLTGPESQSADGKPRFAVYLYEDTGGDLTCVSCGPPGSRAVGESAFTLAAASANSVPLQGPSLGASPFFSPGGVMSADGRRAFFTTRNALVPEDINGRYDVYEWSDGGAHLISPGRAPHDARFEGSSASGDDVVIATDERLVGSDTDVLSDLYDARVGGGFADPPPPPAPCVGEACKGEPSSAPVPPVAASITFDGPASVDVPRLTPPAKVAKLTRVSRTVRGTAVTVKVTVNAAGRVSISGSGVVRVQKSVSRAGTSVLRVRLTAAARRSLNRHHRLKVRLRVGYVPKHGRAASKTVSVSLKG